MTPRGGSPSDERRSLSVGWTISVAVHILALAGLIWFHARPTPSPDASSQIIVNVFEDPAPPGPPADEQAAGAPQDVVSPAPQAVAEPVPQQQPAPVQVVEAESETPVDDWSDVLSESQLAGAISTQDSGAGGGSGEAGGGRGGGCNTAQALQAALQRNPLVQRAVVISGRSGLAVSLWNGDWVRSGVQDGKGLSGVRQALLWELAFTPEACRNKPMHGVTLLSLKDGTRFAIGDAEWRWSELLGLGAAPADR